MAEYKVPQDVEADDKLIGPFSFRQFIYLIVVALAGAAAWGLAQLFVGLAIIPLPIILLFGALALPLRKDQPMEIYLAAIIAFYLKPHRRLWDPDGLDSLVEITAPKTLDTNTPRTKDLSQGEAEQRFGYLANIVDSQGWAIRGVGNQGPLNNDLYLEAQGAQDLLDSNNSIGQSLNSLISQSDDKRREEMVARMREQAATPPTPPPVSPAVDPASAQPVAQPIYNPYPTIQQGIVQPLDTDHQTITQPAPVSSPPVTPAEPTSNPVVSADIMNLATNTDFSIETIAREANRIKEKQDMQDEVVISLR